MFRAVDQQRRVIGIFSDLEAAGRALDRLVIAGFPIAQAFLAGQRDRASQSTDCGNALSVLPASSVGAITGTATGLNKGLVLGNLLGGASGLLVGVGLLALPGVGQVVVSTAIAFTLLSGGVGTAAGGLIGAMIGLGLTTEQAKKYSRLIADGKVLLLVEGSAAEIDRAQHLLEQSIV